MEEFFTNPTVENGYFSDHDAVKLFHKIQNDQTRKKNLFVYQAFLVIFIHLAVYLRRQ